jgi:hypothetical protein
MIQPKIHKAIISNRRPDFNFFFAGPVEAMPRVIIGPEIPAWQLPATEVSSGIFKDG